MYNITGLKFQWFLCSKKNPMVLSVKPLLQAGPNITVHLNSQVKITTNCNCIIPVRLLYEQQYWQDKFQLSAHISLQLSDSHEGYDTYQHKDTSDLHLLGLLSLLLKCSVLPEKHLLFSCKKVFYEVTISILFFKISRKNQLTMSNYQHSVKFIITCKEDKIRLM
jgi:hypothetical protein